MSEETTTPKITPLTEEEISALTKQVEDNKDFDSDLSRALFTILVIGYEYQALYSTLQAYYAASAAACHDVAARCSQIIGLRDLKKIQKMYKVAGEIAGNIPARASDILTADQTETAPKEENNEESN